MAWKEARENRDGNEDVCDVCVAVGWVGVRREQRTRRADSSAELGWCGHESSP